MEIIRVEKDEEGYLVTIDRDDIQELSEAFYTLFCAVQNEERVGNAWNYAMEMCADSQDVEGEA